MAKEMTATATTPESDAGMSQQYIDDLKFNLQSAKRNYDQFGKAAQKAKSEYTITKTYCGDLEDYLERIDDTYNLVIGLEKFIKALSTQVNIICSNVENAKEAIIIIIECYKCVVEQTESLKQLVRSLLDAIGHLNDPVLNPGESLVKCLTDLHLQLEETIKVQQTAMDSFIGIWRSVTNMEYLICNKQDQSTIHSEGLSYNLLQLIEVLCCGYCGGSPLAPNPCPDSSDNASDTLDLEDCCETPPQELKPCKGSTPALCASEIDDDPSNLPGFNSTFYCELEENKEIACELEKYLLCVWNYYKKQEQNAKAKHNAIKAALEAAESAKALCN